MSRPPDLTLPSMLAAYVKNALRYAGAACCPGPHGQGVRFCYHQKGAHASRAPQRLARDASLSA